MQIVGTATRERIPDVPMFSANPAKRPRRETMTDALNVASQKIADALKPGNATNEPAVAVEQVSRLYYS
jgi:hypothetical protein